MAPQLLSKIKQVSFVWKSVFAVALLFCAIAGALIAKERNQPRVEDQTMEWWLDQFAENPADYYGREIRILTYRQLKSVNAFKQFNKQGFDFLVEEAGISKEKFKFSKELIGLLNQIQWIRKKGYFKVPKRQHAARSLLYELEYPFEWIHVH